MTFFYTDHNGNVNGPVTRDQLQEFVDAGLLPDTTQACYEGSEDWQPIAMFVHPTPPPKPRSAVRLIVAVFSGVILGGGALIFAFRHFSTPAAQPSPALTEQPSPRVDSIKGFNSINLGSTLEQLSGRFSPVAPRILEDEEYSGNYQFRTIAELQPDEREWGGAPISKIEVHFRHSIASEIILRFNATGDQWQVLQEAFTQKYGPYTRYDGLHQISWVGHDTEVTFTYYTSSGGVETVFRSLSVERAAQAEETRRDNEDAKRRTDKATEISRKL